MTRATRRRGREVLELVDDQDRTPPFVVVRVPSDASVPESFEASYADGRPRLLVLVVDGGSWPAS